MQRAIALSERGFPAPNPHVGCVVALNGRIVGEGFHAHAGGPHAEVVALGKAGAAAKGSTVYVTLEPCNHHGRTPPCTEALIAAGVERAIIACTDPNPIAAGGIGRLRSAGIAVEVGLLRSDAEAVNIVWLSAIRRRRPYVVAKAAMSLDGRIALASGESRWISGERSRAESHRLRAACGAVLVGRGTVEADDPRLTVRLPGVKNQPLRIMLDPEARLSREKAIFQPGSGTIQVVRQATLEGQIEVPWGRDGFDLAALLKELFQLGVTSLLVEGGAATLTSFLKAGLVDRLELFVGPIALGSGPTWLGDLGVAKLASAPRFECERVRLFGGDVWMTLRPCRVPTASS